VAVAEGSGYPSSMAVQVSLPEDLAVQIDHVSNDRSAFVTEAVKRLLRESGHQPAPDEIDRINELADELNREAEDVLEYQVIP
jgi:metal-responsive CopG/Arc/MetJ family transcriptional regulator